MAAKKTKTDDGAFKIIHCEKTGDKKVVTDESLKAFNNNSPEAGDYALLDGTFATAEEAQTEILKG